MIEITRWIVLSAGMVLAVWHCWRNRKNDPQDQVLKHLLSIETWIIAIFIVMCMSKISVVIAI